ncbi:MAG: fibronectin type III domain-containing protein [Bacteroidetes bacterium]|nr:fibronectin type III domain-containing protein [Bacteroidota bacterium]
MINPTTFADYLRNAISRHTTKTILLTAIALMTINSLSFAQNVPSYVPTNGLVGWWPFNGNANDESGNGNNAVLQGNASFATDRYSVANSSYLGDLTSGADITAQNNFPFGNSERTISLWFQNSMPYPGGNRQLFSYGDNNSGGRFGLYLDGAFIGVEHVNGARRCTYTPDGNWHNITVTYPSSGMGTNDILLYFDGLLQSSSNLNPVSSLNTANSDIHWIGTLGFSPGWLYAFSGKIDDIAIYNRALTQQEITALYNANNCTGIGAEIAVTQPTCGLPNGSAISAGTGGSGSYSYLWSNGATTAAVSNLSAGVYSLTVTDELACTASSSINVNNSICPKLNTQSTVNNITQNSASISWPAVSCANKYRVVVKNISTGTQTTSLVSAPNTTLNLSGLQANTTYQVRIRTQCSQNGSVVSQLSPIKSFTTLNSQGIQCLPPANVSTSGITASAAQINWTPATGALQYNLRYRIVGTGTWSNVVISSGSVSTIIIQNLIAPATYEFQLRSKCNNNPDEFSPYSSLFTFNTGSSGITTHTCGAPNIHNAQRTYGTLTDQQGNVYKTVAIGSQVWMAENLVTGIYRNGDPIANLTTGQDWVATNDGAWLYVNNDSANYHCPLGKIYNWYAVNDARNLCPSGWHMPSDGEWTTLSNFLGGEPVAGGKLKTALGFPAWDPGNVEGTNESGFSALGGGYRNGTNGSFFAWGSQGYWWSATSFETSNNAWSRSMTWNTGTLFRSNNNKRDGYSVRCVRDLPANGRMEEASELYDVQLFPNPANNSINLVIRSSVASQTTIRITDLLGRVMRHETEELTTGTTTITYNISDLASGVYLVIVGKGTEQRAYKLIKE